MSDIEEQLIDVQTRVAYQEDTLAQLNDVITKQDAEFILGLTSQKAVLKFLNLIFSQKVKESVELVNSIFEKGFELSQFIKLSIEEIRKIMLVKSGISLSDLNLDEEEKMKIAKWIEIVTLKDLIKMIKFLKEAEDYLKLSSLPQLALEMAIIEIINPKDSSNQIESKQNDQNQNNDNQTEKDSNIEQNNSGKTIKTPNISSDQKVKTAKNNSVSEIIQRWPEVVEEIKTTNKELALNN